MTKTTQRGGDMNQTKIRVTEDKEKLERIGGREYAELHAGRIYLADIDDGGWAVIESSKFPPDAFEVTA